MGKTNRKERTAVMTVMLPARLTQWSVSRYQTGLLFITFTVAAEDILEINASPLAELSDVDRPFVADLAVKTLGI
jgi:hypothetical protein